MVSVYLAQKRRQSSALLDERGRFLLQKTVALSLEQSKIFLKRTDANLLIATPNLTLIILQIVYASETHSKFLYPQNHSTEPIQLVPATTKRSSRVLRR